MLPPLKRTRKQDFDSASPIVLVVEDEQTNQLVAKKLLEKLGCSVLLAGDGVEALALFASYPIDLVFMDLQMPFMDGFETTHEMRKLEACLETTPTHTPIVALTSCAQHEVREKCLRASMDEYLTKPATMRVLEEVTKRFLKAPV